MFTLGITLVKNVMIVSFAIFLLLGNTYASEEVDGIKQINGEELHEKSCLKCHDDNVYTRKDRTVTSYQKLEFRVNRCSEPAKADWNDDEINAVTDYLNDRYYKFDPLM